MVGHYYGHQLNISLYFENSHQVWCITAVFQLSIHNQIYHSHLLNIYEIQPLYSLFKILWHPYIICCYCISWFFWFHHRIGYTQSILVCYIPILGFDLQQNTILFRHFVAPPSGKYHLVLDVVNNIIRIQLYKLLVLYIFHCNPICWPLSIFHTYLPSACGHI